MDRLSFWAFATTSLAGESIVCRRVLLTDRGLSLYLVSTGGVLLRVYATLLITRSAVLAQTAQTGSAGELTALPPTPYLDIRMGDPREGEEGEWNAMGRRNKGEGGEGKDSEEKNREGEWKKMERERGRRGR